MNATIKPTDKLIVYGHDACQQARYMAASLAQYDIEHEWRDVRTGDPVYQIELQSLANGNLSVPTLVFPDGVVMVEAWPRQMLKKLGWQKPNILERLIRKLRTPAS